MTTLPTDILKVYYRLDETSGTRADAVGGYTLTDVNSVGYTTGKNGNAASFDGSDYLVTNAINTPVITNADGEITIAHWFYLPGSFPSSSSLYTFTGVYSTTNYSHLVRVEKFADIRVRTYWRQSDFTVLNDLADNYPIENAWNHHALRVQKNGSEWKYSQFLNGVETVLTTTETAGFVAFGASTKFAAGAFTTGSIPFIGYVDEASIWGGALTDEQITYLASGVHGSYYPFRVGEINNPFSRPFRRPFIGALT